MRRYISSLLLLLSLSACEQQLASAACDAECDKVQILARQGDASAQTALGRMYANGSNGLSKDEAEAVSLWSKAAAQDYAPAEKRHCCKNLLLFSFRSVRLGYTPT